MPITADLLGLLFACVVMLLIGFVYGSIRMTRYQDDRVDHVVRQNERLVMALGYVYDLFDLPMPNLDVPEPERPPTRWQRLRMWWQTPVGVAEPDAQEALASWEGMNAGEVLAEPEPEPDLDKTAPRPIIRPQPGPRTAPDLKRAAAVAPPAVDYERWKREADEQFARDLAAIRGEVST